MSSAKKTCPDCECELVSIRLIDHAYYTTGDLRYANNRYPNLIPRPVGTIRGWMCPQCNRVQLYAEPTTSPASKPKRK